MNNLKNVSTKFKQALSDGTPVYARAKITLANGTQLELTSENDFFINGNSYSEGGSDGFMLGETICKTINISIDNHDERFSQYDFYKAKIVLYSEIHFNDATTEDIKEGTFTVIDSVAPGDIIEFAAYDDMYKTDVVFTNSIITPITPFELLRKIAIFCDLRLGISSLDYSRDFEIKGELKDYTARQLIGYIAQLEGGVAYFDSNGKLYIKSYDLEAYNQIKIINAGIVKDNLSNYISGGNLSDNLANSINSDYVNVNAKYHLLEHFTTDPEIGTDDITITGLSTDVKNNDGETVQYIVGTEDYMLKIENPLISGQESEGLNLIGQNVIGFTVRPFQGSFFPNPTIECLDTVLIVDRKYNIYQSIVTGFTYNYLDNCDVENTTKSPERNGATYSTNASVVYQRARELVSRERTSWERAVEELNEDLRNASGLYETAVPQDDLSTIYYFHDKPNLNDSQLVIKVGIDVIGISHNGVNGPYDIGLNTVTGRAILNEIYTIGLNADRVITGTMSADRIKGGTLSLGGENNKYGKLLLYNAGNENIGSWDNVAFTVKSYNANFVSNTYTVTISGSGTDSEFIGTRIIFRGKDIATEGATLGIAEDKGGILGFGIDNLNFTNFIGIMGGRRKKFWYYTGASGYDSDIEDNVEIHTLNSAVDLNMHNYAIDNVKIKNAKIVDNFTIMNNTDVRIASNVDMANFAINNVRLNNIVGVGYDDKTPLTGTVPFVKDIQTDPNGIVTSWEKGTLTFENGILVGW